MRQNRLFYVLHSAIYNSDGTLRHLNILELLLDCDMSNDVAYNLSVQRYGVAFLGEFAANLILYNVIQRQMITLPTSGIVKGTKESILCKFLFGQGTKIGEKYTKNVTFYCANSAYMSYLTENGTQLNEEHTGIFLIGFEGNESMAENELRETVQRSFVLDVQGNITPLHKCQHPWLQWLGKEAASPSGDLLFSYVARGLMRLPGTYGASPIGSLPLYLDSACITVKKQQALNDLLGGPGKYEHWYSQRVYSDDDKTGLALTYDLANAAFIPSDAEQISISGDGIAAPLQVPANVMSAKVSVVILDKPLTLPEEMCYVHIYIAKLCVPLCQLPKIVQPARLCKATPYLDVKVEKATNSAYTKTISIPATETLSVMRISLLTQICESLIVPVADNGCVNVTVSKPVFNLSCLPRKKRSIANGKANAYKLLVLENEIPTKVWLNLAEDRLAIVMVDGVLSKPATVAAKLGKYCVYLPNFCCNEVLSVKDESDLNLGIATYKAPYDTTMHIRGNLHSLCITYTKDYRHSYDNTHKKHIYIDGALDYIVFSSSCFDNITVHVKKGFVQEMMKKYNIAARPYAYGDKTRVIKDFSEALTFVIHPSGALNTLQEAIKAGLLIEDL